MYSKLAIRFLFYLILLLFYACHQIDDCFKKTGSITQKIIQIPSNSAIWAVEVFDNIDLVLIPSTEDSATLVSIEAASNKYHSSNYISLQC